MHNKEGLYCGNAALTITHRLLLPRHVATLISRRDIRLNPIHIPKRIRRVKPLNRRYPPSDAALSTRVIANSRISAHLSSARTCRARERCHLVDAGHGSHASRNSNRPWKRGPPYKLPLRRIQYRATTIIPLLPLLTTDRGKFRGDSSGRRW